MAAMETILARKGRKIEAGTFILVYDRHEHQLEHTKPHLSFADVTAKALQLAMRDFSLEADAGDAELLTSSIGRMPPFPEVAATLRKLKEAGFKLAIISNTDDAIIAGNVAQLGGAIDRVITAQQAPSRQIFEHAWQSLDVTKDELAHICASPHLDLTAARDLCFRAVWVDRGTGRRPPADYEPDAVAHGLDDVPGFFEAAGWV
ncbi:HAD family hydrolase [Mesorhizobium sp. M7A.F.Ca.US.011.01.1.1]|uniref:HAD family hydrolase n=1 Tax=Mesorhizobium sp. M7A.F.Ca.US.011.01.1.1 TaxID=2496741 RepID=UPI001FE185D2|nr:HAD family hydrolase [Mesorhizobium sp. M7A.F.Ca.US.011.01.1.1]